MEVGAELRAPGMQVPQDGRGPGADRDLIGREVRSSHAEPLKQRVQARQLPDVLDRHALAAGLPVVLLGVDRDDQERRLGHTAAPFRRGPAVGRASDPPNRGRAATARASPAETPPAPWSRPYMPSTDLCTP